MFFNCYVYCYFGLKRSSVLPCEQRFQFSLAWLLAFTKSFAWLVCPCTGRKQTNHATDKRMVVPSLTSYKCPFHNWPCIVKEVFETELSVFLLCYTEMQVLRFLNHQTLR